MGMKLRALFAAALLALIACAAVAETEREREQRVGKEAAAEIEKRYKVADDPAQVERVSKMVQQIAAVTQRPDVQYTCKVLDTWDINALSLPGGYVYITRGALAAVESDHELAAILAHELAHNSLKHGLELMRRHAKITNPLNLGIIVAVLAGANVDPGALTVAGQVLTEALLSGYSRKAELEADKQAVLYLRKTGQYNPVAMLTVLEGLARMEAERPKVELGILQTHPYAADRAQVVKRQLASLGIPINRRPVLSTLIPAAREVEVNGKTIAEVSIDGNPVFQPAVTWKDRSPLQRAQQMAEVMKELVQQDLRVFEIRLDNEDGKAVIRARGRDIFEIVPGDAAFHGTTVKELGEQVRERLRLAFWAEATRRAY